MRFKNFLSEKAYSGNMGFEELVKFYDAASEKEKKEMERILDKDDWESFKALIKKVLSISLV
jgi:hypothetical protein